MFHTISGSSVAEPNRSKFARKAGKVLYAIVLGIVLAACGYFAFLCVRPMSRAICNLNGYPSCSAR